MLAHNALCEAPLCSLDNIHYLSTQTTLTATPTFLGGYILTEELEHTLILSQQGVQAFGFDITHSLTVTSDMEPNLVYGQAITHALTLTSTQNANMVYAIVVTEPVFVIYDDIKVNNVYNIEICDGVEVYQHLGWVIELEASNTISCTVDEVQSAFTDLVLNQVIETNMDDTSCLTPDGKATEYGPETAVNVAQSIDGKMIYACAVESNMSLLSSVAWR